MSRRDAYALEITRVVEYLGTMDPDSPDYEHAVKNLETLAKTQTVNSDKRLSKDAVLASFTSLAGIAAIIVHEHSHVITTKAFSLITKARI